MTPQPRRSLQAILGRQLFIIAAIVISANVVFVAYYDASDQGALIRDVAKRQLRQLEEIALAVEMDPERLEPLLPEHFADHPEAYGFAFRDPDGTVLAIANEALFPMGTLEEMPIESDWQTWPAGPDELPVVASHTLPDDLGGARVLFVMRSDPAGLTRREVWDEFIGHVLLPLLPITILLMGGAWLVLRRALQPVSDAATWARRVRPGRPIPDFAEKDQSAEIGDLIDAVRRSLDRLNSELEAEQRRAGEAAHALRTPVAVLVARLDALPDDRTSEILRADILALSRTVTQFLSSAGADRLEIGEQDRADLTAVAQRVVSDLAPLAVRHGAEIEIRQEGRPEPVRGSEDAIALALTNLVENAIHHGGPNRIVVTVGPGAEISVRDHGPGLPAGAGESLLKPFWRGPGAQRGGAGLGLAIVDRIQRSHGGRISAATAPGGGAEFRLLYPTA